MSVKNSIDYVDMLSSDVSDLYAVCMDPHTFNSVGLETVQRVVQSFEVSDDQREEHFRSLSKVFSRTQVNDFQITVLNALYQIFTSDTFKDYIKHDADRIGMTEDQRQERVQQMGTFFGKRFG